MFEFFASIFGYLLSVLYNFVNNYGLAIILFTIIIKLLLLPVSIKQQRTMKKSAKLQEKMKTIQFKYKNDQEKMNQEIMELYKTEKMSPFSGCLTTIVQFLLLLSIFYLVKSPLTFMEKIPTKEIDLYVGQLQKEGKEVSAAYPEIDLIREYNWLKEKNTQNSDQEENNKENSNTEEKEESNQEENNVEPINIDKIDLQMNFLGLDLSKIPQQNLTDYTVYIIPVLYILSSFISIRMTTAMQQKQNKKKKETIIDGETGKVEEKEENEMDAVMQTNKMMSWMMPIMSISIALIAPLGLALYWLVSNILMILERLIIDKVIKQADEE